MLRNCKNQEKIDLITILKRANPGCFAWDSNRAARWQAQTDPLSYGGNPEFGHKLPSKNLTKTLIEM